MKTSCLRRRSDPFLATSLALVISGCSRAPAIDVLGSFFPAWIVCLLLAVTLTAICRRILLRTNLEKDVGPLVLFYPCLVLLFTCVSWLLLFARTS